ncbi:MAG: GNAT family N-acetyltransferase [Kangiellaceae bacterium]|nr:GNAT family N-acetyltransferase [Kangiellaceae bacterium]
MLENEFLAGETIILRGLEESDLTAEYLQWLNDEEVCKYNSHAIFPNNSSKMKKYFESLDQKNSVVLAIIHRAENRHIGNISLQSIDWVSRSAEFAILLGNKNFWGKGVAIEAANLIVNYGFERLNLHRIHCGTSSENIGMQKLASNLKMKEEGRRREAMYKNGKFVDMVNYGVLKSEFFS